MNQSSFEDITGQIQYHIEDVEELMEALKKFHEAREQTYQLSFAKRGETGVWLNLVRKTDRLDPLAARVMTSVVTGEEVLENDGVTLVDTLVDMAMYSLKWLAIIKVIRPDHFHEWLEQVFCKDTGMDMQEAGSFFTGTAAQYLGDQLHFTAQSVDHHQITPMGVLKVQGDDPVKTIVDEASKIDWDAYVEATNKLEQ